MVCGYIVGTVLVHVFLKYLACYTRIIVLYLF